MGELPLMFLWRGIGAIGSRAKNSAGKFFSRRNNAKEDVNYEAHIRQGSRVTYNLPIVRYLLLK